MPTITIKDYQWRQTEKRIIIYVPLRNCPKNVNLFIIDNYVKISFSPFILELFLWENVLEEESKCILTDNQAIFSLQKTNIASDWPSLEIKDISKEQKHELRNRVLEKAQNASEIRAKSRSEKRQYLQKEAVKAQINLDTNILNKIECLRDAHRKAAMQDFEEWQLREEIPILQHIPGEMQNNRKKYRPALKWFKDDILQSEETEKRERIKNEINLLEKPNESIVTGKVKELIIEDTKKELIIKENLKKELHIEEKPKKEENIKKKPDRNLIDKTLKDRYYKRNQIFDETAKVVPLPRKNGTINITFSERFFPTAARESCHAEEQEWLSKQAEARRKIGFSAEDLRPEEQDPQWLKDKGDEFFKAGNYLAAISAYTHGIKISDKMATLYLNRSAAHYALGNYYRCIDDCSKVLELMEPQCESNRILRARCYARRGAAFCKLSAPQHGIPELEAALKLDLNNESIKRDLHAAKQYFNIKE